MFKSSVTKIEFKDSKEAELLMYIVSKKRPMAFI